MTHLKKLYNVIKRNNFPVFISIILGDILFITAVFSKELKILEVKLPKLGPLG